MTAAPLESWYSALIERRYSRPSRFFHTFFGFPPLPLLLLVSVQAGRLSFPACTERVIRGRSLGKAKPFPEPQVILD